MGCGASATKTNDSAQQNPQEPSTIQNTPNSNRPKSRSLSSSSSESTIQIQEAVVQDSRQPVPLQQASNHSRAASSVSSPIPSAHNRSTLARTPDSGRNDPITPDVTKRSISSRQQYNNNDLNRKKTLSPTTNRHTTSNRSSLISSSAVVPQLPTNGNQTHLRSSNKHHTPLDQKASPLLAGQTGRCSYCPHCQEVAVYKKPIVSQEKWITEHIDTDQRHIILDNYDQEAVRNRVISENGRLPGGYDYLPNLTIEEKKYRREASNKYFTLPIIAKPGQPISPTRTPFPDYDTIHRREHWLDKPYTLKLFTD